MNINSGITSETLSTLCVLEVVGLKQQISCLDKIFLLSDRVSATEFLKLMLNSVKINYLKIESNYNHFHKTLRLFDVYQTFLSPQVTRCMIITFKHGIYKLLNELPNNLRVRILEN